MDKTSIKNFAIWARNKLMADITYKAGLLGISEKEIKRPLPQSTSDVQFFDIGTKAPYSISGIEIKQREALTTVIRSKEQQSDYLTAYNAVVEEVAYTWFNRLIAVRFMEVNDYLPAHIRVLSSESAGKDEPDLVTNPFDTDLDFTIQEKDYIRQLKQDSQLDELFRMLFIKQCNTLNALLPNLFEKTSDYTELLLNVAFTDKDGVVYRLIHNISENDFNVSKEGQVEIIGWLYQYYNTEPKDETFALLKKNVKITKERIPAATQLFTPDWIVRYMVENSLGRLWLEGHSNDTLKSEWKYYLDEVEQETAVQKQLTVIREEYKNIKPEDIKVIDPCMGSGHILVYAFDVLMRIYESAGYSQRDAAKSIVENNIYGLDIDNRAYQLAYFAVMMKARQYNRRILNGETNPHIYAIQESNGIGWKIESLELSAQSKEAKETLSYVLNVFTDAKEYGSILNVEQRDYKGALGVLEEFERTCELTLENHLKLQQLPLLRNLLLQAAVMAQKYYVVVTNPPYMGISNMGVKISQHIKDYYNDSKSDLASVFIECCNKMIEKNGYQAMITQHSWMFLNSFEKMREKILSKRFVNMVHLGAHAFEEIAGEVVQTTAFILSNYPLLYYKSSFVRLIAYNSQDKKENAFLQKRDIYAVCQTDFSLIMGKPLAYWVSKGMLRVFSSPILHTIAQACKGLDTGNNNLFLRFWHEVKKDRICFGQDLPTAKWLPYSKGGGYRRWYGLNYYIIDWGHDGYDLKYNSNANIRNEKMYFKAGLTWSDLSTNKFGARFCPKGFIFDASGPTMFLAKEDINFILGYINTIVYQQILNIICPGLHYNNGAIAKTPIVFPQEGEKEKVKILAAESVNISKEDWDSSEVSWDFAKHPLLVHKKNGKVAEAYKVWHDFKNKQFYYMKNNEEELNKIFINACGLQDELTPEVDDKDVTIRKANLGRDIRSFVSFAVGCMFGRYSLDKDGLVFAGGDFDDYFRKYKGQAAVDKNGNPIRGSYAGMSFATYHYSDIKIDGAWRKVAYEPDVDNIIPITDEEYFDDDILGLFVVFVKKVYGAETLEENLDFIAKALGNRGNTSREIIRNYFLKDFFNNHCKIYQKRPIYWLFDSGKANGFKALIYMHRYDENNIGNLRVDYLHKMQRIYEREIIRMQETIENSTNAREVAEAEKRKDKLTKQLKEATEYDEKIAHLALARIAIDLDDGVKVNYEKVQTGTDGKKLEVLAKI